MLRPHFFTLPLLFLSTQSYSIPINCSSKNVKLEIEKCTKTVHDFQATHVEVDGHRWLDATVASSLNEKCELAESCLKMLDECQIFEDDDLLWLEDFCDSYQFLTSPSFYSCALTIDNNFKEPCVQHYLVNSPYFMLRHEDRCEALKSDGKCVRSVINSTCSNPNSGYEFQSLLNRQMIRLKC